MSSVQISPEKTGQDRATEEPDSRPQEKDSIFGIKRNCNFRYVGGRGCARAQNGSHAHAWWVVLPPHGDGYILCYPPKEVFSISPYFHLRRFTLYRIVPRCFFSYLFFPIIRSTQSNLEDSSGF